METYCWRWSLVKHGTSVKFSRSYANERTDRC